MAKFKYENKNKNKYCNTHMAISSAKYLQSQNNLLRCQIIWSIQQFAPLVSLSFFEYSSIVSSMDKKSSRTKMYIKVKVVKVAIKESRFLPCTTGQHQSGACFPWKRHKKQSRLRDWRIYSWSGESPAQFSDGIFNASYSLVNLFISLIESFEVLFQAEIAKEMRKNCIIHGKCGEVGLQVQRSCMKLVR